jgi:hypothetical protein
MGPLLLAIANAALALPRTFDMASVDEVTASEYPAVIKFDVGAECLPCRAVQPVWEQAASQFPGMVWQASCSHEPLVFCAPATAESLCRKALLRIPCTCHATSSRHPS